MRKQKKSDKHITEIIVLVTAILNLIKVICELLE